jgi:hypothetical protein
MEVVGSPSSISRLKRLRKTEERLTGLSNYNTNEGRLLRPETNLQPLDTHVVFLLS